MATDPMHDAGIDLVTVPKGDGAVDEDSGEAGVIDGRNATQRRMDEELAKEKEQSEAS